MVIWGNPTYCGAHIEYILPHRKPSDPNFSFPRIGNMLSNFHTSTEKNSSFSPLFHLLFSRLSSQAAICSAGDGK